MLTPSRVFLSDTCRYLVPIAIPEQAAKAEPVQGCLRILRVPPEAPPVQTMAWAEAETRGYIQVMHSARKYIWMLEGQRVPCMINVCVPELRVHHFGHEGGLGSEEQSESEVLCEAAWAEALTCMPFISVHLLGTRLAWRQG